MVTKDVVLKVMDGLQSELVNAINIYMDNHKIDFSGMSYDDAHNKIGDVLDDLKRIVIGVRFEDFGFPKMIVSYKSYEDNGKLDSVVCTIKTGLKAKTKYSHKSVFSADGVMDGLKEEFITACIKMAEISIAEINIDCLNERLYEVLADSDVSFKFVLGDNYVEDIDDKEVVFGATIEGAFEVSNLKIMHNTEDYGEFSRVLAEEEQTKILDAVKGRTTPQVMKSGLEVIEVLTGSKPKNRADRLLRLTYHNQAKYFNDTAKEAVGYVRKTINVDGEDVDIFALLKKTKEGKIEVKLSPFNIKTTFNVDYDICNNYKD